jgi:ABC-type enterobactin transport system permease subunit
MAVPLIVVALYAARSLMRGTWRPDLPMDLVVLVMVSVVILVVARLRATMPQDADDEHDESGACTDDAAGPAS